MLNFIFELIANLLEKLYDYRSSKNPKKTKPDKQTKDLNQELLEIIDHNLNNQKMSTPSTQATTTAHNSKATN